MAEENPITTPAASPATVVPTRSTVETIDANGKTLAPNTNLADIFSKIESGTPAKDAVQEVMTKTKPEPKEVSVTTSHPDKPEEKQEEAKEESPANIDEQFKKSQKDKDEPKSGKVAEDKKFEGKTEDDVPDEELQVLPHDKPKTAKRISALLAKITKANDEVVTTKKDAEAKATKLKDLETQLATVKTVDPKTEEAVKQQLDELSMYRRRYDLEKDPEVKSKFDDRIKSVDEQLDSAVPSILQKHGGGEALLARIKEEGGWVKFSQSPNRITLNDGEVVVASDLADRIISSIPFSDRKMIDAMVMEQIQVKRDKERYVQEQVKVAGEFFKKRDEEQAKAQEMSQQQIKQATEMIDKWRETTSKSNDWLQEKPIPTSATAAEKKAIEEDNAYAKELQSVLQKNLGTKDIEGMLGVVLESVQYHKERREVAKLMAKSKELETQLKAKQDELDRFKNSGRTIAKSGSIAGGGSAASAPKEKKPASLEEAFDAIASGSASD